MNSALQILIIEDHEIVSAALEQIIEKTYNQVKVSKVSTFPEAIKVLDSGFMPNLIILDMEIPGGESYDMIDKLRKNSLSVRILIFSGHNELTHAIPFLSAGADGYLPKNTAMAEIPLAIKMVMNGKKYITPEVQQQITDKYFDKSVPKIESKNVPLSPREEEVMALMLQGKWTKEIAQVLNLKVSTVSSHKNSIFEKMNVTNVVDLVKKMQ